ncbi:MAG: MBL fold metallo-hydrolase [Deltaproteobacteria bacterium]
MAAKKTSRAPFHVRFWGVRGSYPTSVRATLGYGGHSSCVEVEAGGQRIIFDAGTGIIPLGQKLVRRRKPSGTLTLFFSHTHHDHIFGLYFFEPLFHPAHHVCIFGPKSAGNSLEETLRTIMDRRFFPVGVGDFKATTRIYSLQGGVSIQLSNSGGPPQINQRSHEPSEDHVTILAHRSSAHPNGVFVYRVCYRDKSMVYATDVEGNEEENPDMTEFFRGADLLVHDAQYFDAEYFSRTSPRKGWGHSTVEQAARIAHKAKVKKLALFHHDPSHNDTMLKRMAKIGRRRFPATLVASEGLQIEL